MGIDLPFLFLSGGQNSGGISATEWRQKIAHGASRGNAVGERAAERRKNTMTVSFAPAGAPKLSRDDPTADAVGYRLALLRS